MSIEPWEVFAIRYAHMPTRRRSDNFIGGDPHDGPMPMDFFVWVLRQGDRAILVDTGFSAATARVRQRDHLRCPIEAVRMLGVDPDRIQDVVLTHLHYDHAGNVDRLPAARFHLQDREMDYATGRCMCHAPLRHAFGVDDVVTMVRHVYAERVVFHDGDDTIAPGVELLLVGGHTAGLQSVRVFTKRGWIVLASDAAHYYENALDRRPFIIAQDVGRMLDGHGRLLALAGSPTRFVPGHDPLVLARYPRLEGDPIGTACLHFEPSE